jgi:hypothetical protein
LRALRTLGYIGQKPVSAVDGMYIFSVVKPLSVFGYKVVEVTGYEDSSDKSLFWRGPGTATPLLIQVVVEGDPKLVAADLARRFPSGPAVERATFTKHAGATSEITCYGR